MQKRHCPPDWSLALLYPSLREATGLTRLCEDTSLKSPTNKSCRYLAATVLSLRTLCKNETKRAPLLIPHYTCISIFSMKLTSLSTYSSFPGNQTEPWQALLYKAPQLKSSQWLPVPTEDFSYFYLLYRLFMLGSSLILKNRIISQAALESLPLLFNN